MRRVIIESPFAGNITANVAYARQALRDSLSRGEAPLASHLLYPQVLRDADPAERELGITAGLAWYAGAHIIAFYCDQGISPGMQRAYRVALMAKRLQVELRWLDGLQIARRQAETHDALFAVG